MSIKTGSDDIGNGNFQEVYVGETKVWGFGDSTQPPTSPPCEFKETLTASFRTYSVTDRLTVFDVTDNNKLVLDTDCISTGDNFQSFNFDVCAGGEIEVCVFNCGDNTDWDLEIRDANGDMVYQDSVRNGSGGSSNCGNAGVPDLRAPSIFMTLTWTDSDENKTFLGRIFTNGQTIEILAPEGEYTDERPDREAWSGSIGYQFGFAATISTAFINNTSLELRYPTDGGRSYFVQAGANNFSPFSVGGAELASYCFDSNYIDYSAPGIQPGMLTASVTFNNGLRISWRQGERWGSRTPITPTCFTT